MDGSSLLEGTEAKHPLSVSKSRRDQLSKPSRPSGLTRLPAAQLDAVLLRVLLNGNWESTALTLRASERRAARKTRYLAIPTIPARIASSAGNARRPARLSQTPGGRPGQGPAVRSALRVQLAARSAHRSVAYSLALARRLRRGVGSPVPST